MSHPCVGEGAQPPRFRLGASSMVYGDDLRENVERLSQRLTHVEIVLFHTQDLHNLPDERMLAVLHQLGEANGLTYSIHLPASLEIATPDGARREESIRLASKYWRKVARISPIHCVMHVPYTPPTLVPVPGSYFKGGAGQNWDRWLGQGLASLRTLEEELGWVDRLLIENINFSPSQLVPLLESGLCGLCLDLGHLVLGGESVTPTIRAFQRWIREVHLHGVSGDTDHLGVGRLPRARISKWLKALSEIGFEGVMNLEVFTAEDFEESLAIVEGNLDLLKADSVGPRPRRRCGGNHHRAGTGK